MPEDGVSCLVFVVAKLSEKSPPPILWQKYPPMPAAVAFQHGDSVVSFVKPCAHATMNP